MDVVWWLSIGFLVVLLVVFLFEDLRLLCGPLRVATGTVVDHCSITDDGSVTFHAKVRFIADDGSQIEIVDQYGGSSPKPPVGATLDVIYPAGRPRKARVRRLWLRVVLYFFVIGTSALLLAHAAGLVR